MRVSHFVLPLLPPGESNHVRCVRENLKHERSIAMPTQTHADLFGVPLEDLMGYDGEKDGLPRVVRDCVQYLREAGVLYLKLCFLVLAVWLMFCF